jgi:hypothetical protein
MMELNRLFDAANLNLHNTRISGERQIISGKSGMGAINCGWRDDTTGNAVRRVTAHTDRWMCVASSKESDKMRDGYDTREHKQNKYHKSRHGSKSRKVRLTLWAPSPRA